MTIAFRLLALSLALALTACGGASDAELLARARAHLDKRETAAAVIELKNLLQQNPDSGEGRFLLGRLQLEAGDLAGAEEHLRRAAAAGYADKEVYPLLASVLVARQKPADLLQQFGQVEIADDLAAAEYLTHLASAHLMNRTPSQADEFIKRALKRSPTYPPAILLQARILAVRGDVAGAMSTVDALLAAMPTNGRAWMLKGDLLMENKPPDAKPAMAAYRKALEADARLLPAHSRLLSMQVDLRDFEAAAQQLDALRKVYPEHSETHYFEALLALQKGDAARTREITAALLRGKRQDPRVMLLAAQAEMQLNGLVQAESLLNRLLQMTPDAAAPRRMLAQLYLRSGQEEKAQEVLKPLLAARPNDAGLLALLGQAQMMAGDTQTGGSTLAKASQLQPQDKRIRTAAAVARLGQGQDAAALAELESVAAGDKGIAADLALISVRLRRQEFDGALKAIQALAVKQPKSALPEVLRGRIALQRKDPAGARKLFEAALVKEPGQLQAVLALAGLDVADNKLPAAQARLEAELQRKPGQVAIHLALARVAALGGATRDAVTALLERAAAAGPTAVQARIALVDHHMAGDDKPRALSAAQAAVAANADSAPLQDLLGRVQMATGDLQQALPTFRKLQALEPRSAMPWVRIAGVYMAQKNPTAAVEALQKAVALPDGADAATPLHLALVAAGKTDEARSMAQDWIRTHPKDVNLLLHLAQQATQQKDLPAAEARYREVLQRAPGNLAALNNLAYLLAEQKKPGGVAMAEQALKLAPEQPNLLDTLAFAYAQDGQIAKALTHQGRAVALAPGNDDLRLALARLQIQAGDKVAARAELDKLAARGAAYRRQDEVTKLRASLGG
jgi:putative PEP-CTERM system TPR-repeat lipoprotein